MSAIKLYKISRYFYKAKLIILAKIFQKLNYYLHNSYIPYTCEIGEKSRFAYGGIGVVLHKDCKIGKNCMIGQGVTIGGRTGPGAPIIGANSVVIKNVEENTIVGGIPAKIISKDMEKIILYNNIKKEVLK